MDELRPSRPCSASSTFPLQPFRSTVASGLNDVVECSGSAEATSVDASHLGFRSRPFPGLVALAQNARCSADIIRSFIVQVMDRSLPDLPLRAPLSPCPCSLLGFFASFGSPSCRRRTGTWRLRARRGAQKWVQTGPSAIFFFWCVRGSAAHLVVCCHLPRGTVAAQDARARLSRPCRLAWQPGAPRRATTSGSCCLRACLGVLPLSLPARLAQEQARRSQARWSRATRSTATDGDDAGLSCFDGRERPVSGGCPPEGDPLSCTYTRVCARTPALPCATVVAGRPLLPCTCSFRCSSFEERTESRLRASRLDEGQRLGTLHRR